MRDGDARALKAAAKRDRRAWWLLWRPRLTMQRAVRQRPKGVANRGDGQPTVGVMRLRRRVGRWVVAFAFAFAFAFALPFGILKWMFTGFGHCDGCGSWADSCLANLD